MCCDLCGHYFRCEEVEQQQAMCCGRCDINLSEAEYSVPGLLMIDDEEQVGAYLDDEGEDEEGEEEVYDDEEEDYEDDDEELDDEDYDDEEEDDEDYDEELDDEDYDDEEEE